MATSKSLFCLCDISWKTLVVLILSAWLPCSEPAAVALPQYMMDQKSDCVTVGFLDIPRGQTTKLIAPSKDTASSTQVLSCRLQFGVQTEGDTLRVTLTRGSFMEDCDVSLEIQMMNSNSDRINWGCKSGNGVAPVLEAVNGKVSVWLARKLLSNTGYWFEISVAAVRTEAAGNAGNASTDDVGLIVGVTTGVIAFIVIAVIICVCCYRKQHGGDKEHTKNEQNANIINSQFTNAGHGYENNMAKISYDDSFQKSPDSGRKLLNDSGKPRSALDRFGHTPTYRGQSNVETRQTEIGRGTEKYEERNFGRTRINQEDREPVKPRDISVQKAVRDTTSDTNDAPPTSVLAALHSNPKFRKSFHENEADAEERVRRVSDRSSVTNSSSAESETMPVTKPRLPPVPKSPPRSPSPQRQGEKIAGIFRAGHSSTSSSEVTRLESEESEDRDVKVKHTLRPTNEKSKKSSRKHKDVQSDDDTDESRKREKERRAKRKEEKREKSKDNEKRHKKEKGPGSVAESDDRSQYKEYEGRFKKSASGRKPKGKGQRMGRSRSTGNALEELDSNYQSTRSKSPSSVRSLILAEDDDDDELDSNYTSFKRSGSKTSLYASRSSLYGRRRKNSMGETMSMSSYMHDDMDSRMGDFDRPQLSHKEKERLFKSTGDLDFSSESAVVFRECATQTGNTKEVYIYGRRTVIRSRPGKLVSRGTQTSTGKERRDSTGSARSGRSARSNRLKSRSKSQESLRKQKSSRSRDYSDDDNVSERSHHRRLRRNQDRDYSDDDNASERSHHRRRTKSHDRDLSNNENKQSRHHSESGLRDDDYNDKKSRRSKSRDRDSDSYRPKQKPKPKSRRLPSTASNEISDSDDDRSTVISSIAPSSIQQVGQQINHIPHYIPTGYPLTYPQPGVAYISTAPGGPPIMIPVASVPQSHLAQKPSIAPKPNATKWDQLVNLTEGMKNRRHQMGESLDTESVLSSTWSQPMPYGSHPQAHYSQSPYNAAQRMHDSGSLYASTYAESIDVTKLPKEYSRRHAPTDSNV